MLLPIIMICVCALLGGGTLIFLKLSAKHKKSKNKDKEELAQITANEFEFIMSKMYGLWVF